MGIQYEKNAVVITEAPAMNYFGNHVRLPKDYGTPAYDARPDVKAIKQTVRKSLDDLDAATGWKAKFRGRKVLIKPNLVFVYLKEAGRFKEDNPQTTDPRVFDAVVENLVELGCDVLIGEGSGLVTWLYARMTGYDRIAKHYGIKMTFFEEEPMVHYFVPHAEVGQDVYVPQSFREVIEGERLYVSVPKTKTNVYTGVTLGFKNGMGTFSPNMRYRNHNWKINKKLADLLYLFKPDLTVVDAIIGGGGNTPGPNIPVEMNRIVCGSNSVEVDRVVTELMGFDPSKNKLLIEASARNFGDPNVEIIGEKRITPFEPAEPSVMTDKFHKNWPRVHGYAGWTNERAPKLEKIDGNPRSLAQEMEAVNAGFDGASMATTFECMLRGYTYPLNKYRRVNIIYGDGAELNGVRYWLGEDGPADGPCHAAVHAGEPGHLASPAVPRRSLPSVLREDVSRRFGPPGRAALRRLRRQALHHPGTGGAEPRRGLRGDPHAEDGPEGAPRGDEGCQLPGTVPVLKEVNRHKEKGRPRGRPFCITVKQPPLCYIFLPHEQRQSLVLPESLRTS